MRPTVHILATVRKSELLPAAEFVFRTLRVGFPKSPVHVWGNCLTGAAELRIGAWCREMGLRFANLQPCAHDQWVEGLIDSQTEPFWICDTDVAFWESVEDWPEQDERMQSDGFTFAGRHEPEFHEEWTDTLHVERLHTCLMYIDPARCRAAMREWTYRIPEPWRNLVEYPFVRLNIVPRLNKIPLCYDTMAGLYQAVSGYPFSERQNEAFDHLGCATYADKVELTGVDLRASHAAAFANPQSIRGIWKQQQRYYAQRSSKFQVPSSKVCEGMD
jgi:hypothetical protein